MLDVGDILCVRTTGIPAELIRAGASMDDLPNLDNHVAGMHHTDAAGVPWGIEGRPGGVGWVDLRIYLGHPYVVNNIRQPKTPDQRSAVAAYLVTMLGTPYDWEGIGLDAMRAIHAPDLWGLGAWNGAPPAHVVCSSLYAYAYDTCGLEHPTSPDRITMPADWTALFLQKDWHEPTVTP